jgi:predicted nuclease of predicted toxin-antitoxin system
MYFLIDEDTDARIADTLRARGHTVEFSKDVLGRSAPDPLVAAAAARLGTIAADRLGAIVVTRNYRHFRRLIRRNIGQEQTPYPNAGLICLRCANTSCLRRMSELISVIEAEYDAIQHLPDPRLIVEITETAMQIIR